jgi:DNA-binding NtrC family response regulator
MKILLVDDIPAQVDEIEKYLRDIENHEVVLKTNSQALLDEMKSIPSNFRHFQVAILDQAMPSVSGFDIGKSLREINPTIYLIMLTAWGNIEDAVKAITDFNFHDYLQKPIELDKLKARLFRAKQFITLSIDSFQKGRTSVEKELENIGKDIIHKSEEMKGVLKLVSKVLNNDITVLITGESGTGKELIARAIHDNGKRKTAPFVVVNCASIPHGLLESELFGHERGSFTGAHARKIGKFELAKGGTIFLDEIGEMEMALQAKILRVIQQKEFERVGGNEIIKTDVRIISATNRDLKVAVENKSFREDLYYRLSSFPINILPLRERKGDIILLVKHFIKQFNTELSKQIKKVSETAMRLLNNYNWPGNIRELENTIQWCMILAESETIEEKTLPENIINYKATSNSASNLWPSENNRLGNLLNDLERACEDACMRPEDIPITKLASIIGCSGANLHQRFNKNKSIITSLAKACPTSGKLLRRTVLWKKYIDNVVIN